MQSHLTETIQTISAKHPLSEDLQDILYYHPSASLTDFNAHNQKLLSDEIIQKIQNCFAEEKENIRYSRRYLQSQGINISRGGVIRIYDDELKQYVLYATYKNCCGISIVLGEGGWGKVKLIQNLTTGKFHVLKVLNKMTKESSPDRLNERIEVFKQETEFTHSCNKGYAQVIRKRDGKYSLKDNKYYAIQDWIPGINLRDVLIAGSLTLTERFNIASQAFDEVLELHKQGIIHNDIKESNYIYNARNGKVTLIDFGGAKFKNTFSKYTVIHTACVSAPETKKEIFSENSDVFSLGYLLAEIFGNISTRKFNKSTLTHGDTDKHAQKNLSYYQSELVTRIAAITRAMTNDEPSKRMLLSAAIKQLELVFTDFLKLPSKQEQVKQFEAYVVSLVNSNLLNSEKTDKLSKTIKFLSDTWLDKLINKENNLNIYVIEKLIDSHPEILQRIQLDVTHFNQLLLKDSSAFLHNIRYFNSERFTFFFSQINQATLVSLLENLNGVVSVDYLINKEIQPNYALPFTALFKKSLQFMQPLSLIEFLDKIPDAKIEMYLQNYDNLREEIILTRKPQLFKYFIARFPFLIYHKTFANNTYIDTAQLQLIKTAKHFIDHPKNSFKDETLTDEFLKFLETNIGKQLKVKPNSKKFQKLLEGFLTKVQKQDYGNSHTISLADKLNALLARIHIAFYKDNKKEENLSAAIQCWKDIIEAGNITNFDDLLINEMLAQNTKPENKLLAKLHLASSKISSTYTQGFSLFETAKQEIHELHLTNILNTMTDYIKNSKTKDTDKAYLNLFLKLTLLASSPNERVCYYYLLLTSKLSQPIRISLALLHANPELTAKSILAEIQLCIAEQNKFEKLKKDLDYVSVALNPQVTESELRNYHELVSASLTSPDEQLNPRLSPSH